MACLRPRAGWTSRSSNSRRWPPSRRTVPERDVALGLAYARIGRTDMAVLALGRAAEEHPEQPLVYTALGRVWFDIARDHGRSHRAQQVAGRTPVDSEGDRLE